MKKAIINKKIQARSNRKSTHLIKDNWDSDILFQIKKYLKRKYHIPTNQIKIEHSIKFTDNDYKIMGKLTYIKISNITKSFLIHTPDIIIFSGKTVPLIEIIEYVVGDTPHIFNKKILKHMEENDEINNVVGRTRAKTYPDGCTITFS